MHLQKGVQYHGGTLVGADENGELYTGVMVFMVVGLKESIPFVVKACPEFKIAGKWLSEEIEDTLITLFEASLNVRAVITDNHSTNVLSFKSLRKKYGEHDNVLSFDFMGHKTYNLYDSAECPFN